MLWSKDVQKNILSKDHQYPVSYLTGEAGELAEELKKGNLPGILDEFSDTAYALQMIAAQRSGLNLPLAFADKAYQKFYLRRTTWKEIFKKYGKTFDNKYMVNGSNYHRPEKIQKALALAGVKISTQEANKMAASYILRDGGDS